MIHSMTGFGEAQREEDGHVYHLEIRSVNSRYFKAAIRAPEDFSFIETELERMLRARLTRGSVTLRLMVRDLSATAAHEINVAAVQRYVSQFQSVVGTQPGLTFDLATLAMLPGVCQPPELNEQERERGWKLIAELTKTALDRVAAMRAAEGRALTAELKTHCQRVREQLAAVRQRAPRVVDEYRERLANRVQELIGDSSLRLAEQDLLKEVAIYAERSDISEEISRLRSHLDQFDACTASPEPAGRKMEFIAQEMLREANTIGAKAGDSEIARHIVEIKGAIDRIKEQVLNVE
jgi:uncharacterized protein (TIGR00255 family)